ncbi:fimbrial biogenesis usher protein [Citrobacter sp. JGM124]|uniref:fimbrial biogenesis usher protein n=1 Tax=Citrobacter sp. JGM124 TaxID=2799789 RepID=UPI0020117B15
MLDLRMIAIRQTFQSTLSHRANGAWNFTRLSLALMIAALVSPANAEIYFNPRFLNDEAAESVDLSVFENGQEAPPGTYRVDIEMNGEYITSRDITFEAGASGEGLIPCLSPSLLESFGVKKEAFSTTTETNVEERCVALSTMLPNSSTEFDVGQLRLTLSIPQIYVSSMARGYISPDLWEDGINAGIVNYSFSGNNINSKNNRSSGNSNYAYLNLQSGLNLGAWRLRDSSIWSYSSGVGEQPNNNKWQHINTWAERDIISLRSRLTLGDGYTDGDIFEGVNLRGVKINSIEAMLPDSQRGFAPVIHGIARGTAQVSVRQNGYEVYQSTVPPGPFTIDDIYSAANGGDLQVTVKEADGSTQVFYVPYSTVPVLQRAGYTRYAFAAGEYRSGNDQQDAPKFVQGTLMHGLSGGWTPYGGAQLSQKYQAVNIGLGKDLGSFGAVSMDITQANTKLADDTHHSGQSARFLYSKSFYQTGTNIQLMGYRYSTNGYYNFSDSAYSRMSGYTVQPDTDGNNTDKSQYINYYNLLYTKRGQEQISISQQIDPFGTIYLSANRQSYWNTSNSDQQISIGANVPFDDINTSLSYSFSNNAWQNERDHTLAFNINIPFSHWMRSDSKSVFKNANASYSMSNDMKGGMTNLAGINGTLLSDRNLSYSVQVGHTKGANSSTGSSGYTSLNYRGGYGNANLGYSRSGQNNQIYYGFSGGIIAHANGVTFGQPLGETLILIKAPGADGVKVENQTGIHTDWRGYALIPYATEYRENRVALNINSLQDNVELEETVVSVVPTHGAVARATFNAQIGNKVLMTLKYKNKFVPFGAIVTQGDGTNGSIVAESGQVYLTGLPQAGKLQVSWGNGENANCVVDYQFPATTPGTPLNQQSVICH